MALTTSIPSSTDRSRFNPDPEPEDPTKGDTADTTVAGDTDVPGGWGGKDMSELVGEDLKFAYDEGTKTFDVTGTINYVPDWEAYAGADQTNYYVPIKIMGNKGQVVAMPPLSTPETDKLHTFGETNDGDNFMVLICGFSEENFARKFRIYENMEAYEADETSPKSGGVTYTVDCSGATFAPEA